MKQTQWDALLRRYMSYIALERGLSGNSTDSYGRDIRQFAEYLLDTHGVYPPQAEPHHIEAYLTHIYDRGLVRTSQARILSGLKSFYRFLLLEGVIETAPTELIEAPKVARRLPDTLTLGEIDAILASIDLSAPQGHRNRAMLEMLYSCGLRVSELTALRLGDLFFDDGFLRVTGKGRKQRLVPMSAEVARCVKLYLDRRRTLEPQADSRDVLFLNRRGGAMSRVMVFKIMKEAVAGAGIGKTVSPHTFRHSFATHLLEGGANIRQIQEMLGHESILTTEIYTHLDRSHLRRSVSEHHPLK